MFIATLHLISWLLSTTQCTHLKHPDTWLCRPPKFVEGQLAVIAFKFAKPCATTPTIEWMTYRLTPFTIDDHWQAFLPVPLGTTPGDVSLDIVCDGKPTTTAIPIVAGVFGESKVNVPTHFTEEEPPPRVAEEQDIVNKALAQRSPARFWRQAFSKPTQGRRTSAFGVRRMYNDTLQGWHRGIDYRGKIGTRVVAANDGVVVLASDNFYFIGNAVIIDHGMQVFTLYLHLDRVKVKVGDTVKRGQRIGSIGKTGRASGPHLHFAVRVEDAYVNPKDLLNYKPVSRKFTAR